MHDVLKLKYAPTLTAISRDHQFRPEVNELRNIGIDFVAKNRNKMIVFSLIRTSANEFHDNVTELHEMSASGSKHFKETIERYSNELIFYLESR